LNINKKALDCPDLRMNSSGCDANRPKRNEHYSQNHLN
jgi:hypothetical protein